MELRIETLYEDTILRLKECPITYTALSQATGITTRWFHYVMSAQIKDPSVKKCVTLHVALDKAERELAAKENRRKDLLKQLKEID